MNKVKAIILVSLMLTLILTACTTYQYKPNDAITGEVISEENNMSSEEVVLPEGEENASAEFVAEENATAEISEEDADVVALEGELIDLKPFVKDPDGDLVTLGFTQPFDDKGVWQTKEGDAGFYSIIVTATDNKDSFVTKQMTVKVLVKNKSPKIEMPDMLEFAERDMIVLTPNVTDEDSRDVFVTYGGWMTSKTYQTTYDDAGSHDITIIADDGKTRTVKEVKIIVKDVDRKPEIEFGSDEKITVTEEEAVEISVKANDPDGQKVTLDFSEPMSESGKWLTKKGDAGNYTVKVTASDGVNEVVEEIEVEVLKKNNAPTITSATVSPMQVILKKPGDSVTVKIDVVSSDPDGDELTTTFAGDMDSVEKTWNYGEKGGVKTVTVTVSDGKEQVTMDVTFDVNNWPCFDCQ